MEAYHNSRESKFRQPFGAVRPGTGVCLNIDVWGDELKEAWLRIWVNGSGELRLPMCISQRPGGYTASATFVPEEKGLYWYRFELYPADGGKLFYGSEPGRTGGVGTLTDHEGNSYQLTVSTQRRLPDWYTEGIAYLIFPDRFRRSLNSKTALEGHENGPERRLVPWDRPVSYERNDDGSIAAWDFYGGDLKGITEKLPYLSDLGISVIYLNPIFEAASSHRYDTGDYMRIDPLLGTGEDFKELCRRAGELGISIVLDGVFNHTGSDSIYFNKYGNYPGVGAFQGEDSPYSSWYKQGSEFKNGYDSWWGIADLPNVDETNAEYRRMIYDGADNVISKWLRAGAKGWRLDVADELPDEFIAGIKSAVISESKDNLLMGEVWEDASNKISYGKLRSYLLGDELDCVMNYPAREGIGSFLKGEISAGALSEILWTLKENYPRESFYGSFNLLGSHDRLRVLTWLSGAPSPEALSDEERAAYELSADQLETAKRRLWLAALVQMTIPGVPCIYYGDEAGLYGYADPYNRKPYPWGSEDADCMNIYRNAIEVRRSHRLFINGEFEPFSCGDDVFGLTRRLGDEAATVLINRSLNEERTVSIPVLGEFFSDMVQGRKLCADNGSITVCLGPGDSAVIYFSPYQRLQKIPEPGDGVLCHITSLPAEKGKGTFGKPAMDFLEELKAHGKTYWQILPLNPTDEEGSPYSGTSAFAGNTELLADDGFFGDGHFFTAFSVDGFSGVDFSIESVLSKKAAKGSSAQVSEGVQISCGAENDTESYESFKQENSYWLRGYAMFTALSERFGTPDWMKWDAPYRSWSEKLYEDTALARCAEYHMLRQFRFDRQWSAVRKRARELGISIIGDMPLYVSASSADAWQYPEMFTLSPDEEGGRSLEAGVPPDYFSEEGQLWGNPVYRWDRIRKDGYRWWLERLKRSFKLYDYVRLDHFRGFMAYWAVPRGLKATRGCWHKGPGREFFEKAFEMFGPLPVIAEDLGVITPGVRALVDNCGFHGMDVLQFSDVWSSGVYEPGEERIAYTGTHDNNTLLGWCRENLKKEAAAETGDACEGGKEAAAGTAGAGAKAAGAAEAETRNHGTAGAGETHEGGKADDAAAADTHQYDEDASDMADRFMRIFENSNARIKIVLLQDLLGLDDNARMNVPGTVGRNWKWQAEAPLKWRY